MFADYIFSYTGKTGTSHIKRHSCTKMKSVDDKHQSSLIGFVQTNRVPCNVRSELAAAAAEVACKDLRLLRLFECEGSFLLLSTSDI